MKRTHNAKKLVLIGFATAATLALAACSGGSPESSESPESGGSPEADGQKTTLTVWHYFSDEAQVKVMTDYEDLFESNNPDVDVQNVFVPYDQFTSKLIASATAESGPDVVVFNGGEASTLALAGTLAPLDDYWPSFADADQFPDSVIHSVDDSLYMVQGYVNLLGLWYNKDILDEIGVEPPTTIEELTEAMAVAKAAGYEGITLSGLPQGQGEWQAYPWLTSQGFDYENLDAVSLEKGYDLVKGWVDEGYLTKESTTWDQTVPFQRFAAGGVAFAENGNWQQGTAAATAKFNYGVTPMPIGASGKIYLGGEAEGIGAFSKNPDIAWKYLEETYFSYEGQIIALNVVGSIPSRADAGADDAVSSNELIAAFAYEVANNGGKYPPAVVKPEGVTNLQLVGGQIWSAVIAGQTSPKDAAAELIKKVQPYLR